MANLAVEGQELVVHLSFLEKLGALRRSDVRLPLDSDEGARVRESLA
jgi:hypothetical protein